MYEGIEFEALSPSEKVRLEREFRFGAELERLGARNVIETVDSRLLDSRVCDPDERMLVDKGSDDLEELREMIVSENFQKFDQLFKRRAERAARMERGFQQKSVEGLGEAFMQVDAGIYNLVNFYYPGCWSDPEFVREWYNDNPECRIITPKSKYI